MKNLIQSSLDLDVSLSVYLTTWLWQQQHILPFHTSLLISEVFIFGCSCKLDECTGFVCQGFGSGGAPRVTFVRRWRKAPPSPIEPMPAGSKVSLLLAKAEPICDGDRASGIEIFKRKEKMQCNSIQERGMETCPRNGPADARVRVEKGGGAEVSPQGAVQPMLIHGGAEIHLLPMEDPTLKHVISERRLWA